MALQSLDFEAEDTDPPEPFAALIADADRLWNEFWAKGRNRRYPRYIASEPAQVYAALKYVRDQNLALGDTFVEWGSGFGVATCLASLLGYEATGIELQEGLVAVAESLADAHGLAAEFLALSYIPEGFIEYESAGGTDIVPDDGFGNRAQTPPHYEGMDIPIEEVDVFFAYPWPGEQEMMLKLFDAVAGEGAILVAYFGDREISLYRKTTPP